VDLLFVALLLTSSLYRIRVDGTRMAFDYHKQTVISLRNKTSHLVISTCASHSGRDLSRFPETPDKQ
jgi:hypothetical protein